MYDFVLPAVTAGGRRRRGRLRAGSRGTLVPPRRSSVLLPPRSRPSAFAVPVIVIPVIFVIPIVVLVGPVIVMPSPVTTMPPPARRGPVTRCPTASSLISVLIEAPTPIIIPVVISLVIAVAITVSRGIGMVPRHNHEFFAKTIQTKRDLNQDASRMLQKKKAHQTDATPSVVYLN